MSFLHIFTLTQLLHTVCSFQGCTPRPAPPRPRQNWLPRPAPTPKIFNTAPPHPAPPRKNIVLPRPENIDRMFRGKVRGKCSYITKRFCKSKTFGTFETPNVTFRRKSWIFKAKNTHFMQFRTYILRILNQSQTTKKVVFQSDDKFLNKRKLHFSMTRSSTISGASLLRSGVTTLPATLKTRSDLEDAAGMAKTTLTSNASLDKMILKIIEAKIADSR